MKQNVNDIIRAVAKQHGVTEQEVLADIQAAIDVSYHSPDPAAQEAWASMPFARMPTPQELIAYFGERLTLH